MGQQWFKVVRESSIRSCRCLPAWLAGVLLLLTNWRHPLEGDRAGQWSVCVSGNWRVLFRFEDGEAVDVDLIDYH